MLRNVKRIRCAHAMHALARPTTASPEGHGTCSIANSRHPLRGLVFSRAPTFARAHGQAAMKSRDKSLEECLQEAAECERLARLARSREARLIMTLSAAAWRKRAQEMAEQGRLYLH